MPDSDSATYPARADAADIAARLETLHRRLDRLEALLRDVRHDLDEEADRTIPMAWVVAASTTAR